MTQFLTPQSIPEVQEAVRSAESVFPRGASTKPFLSQPNFESDTQTTIVEMSALSGILEYQPNEYTFTALAGTPIATVEKALAAEGQYLPFEPPWSGAGATLGGTVAAGLSGAGRYRYGGVRDFLIGIHFVDGNGDLVMGGGKVVKNAAGFDLPKLLVGSMGRLGILVDLSFKVFPVPKTYRTLQIDYLSMAEAVEGLNKLTVAPMDIDAVELIPAESGSNVQMLIRIGGMESVLYARLGRLEDLLSDGTIIGLEAESSLWQDLGNFSWVPTSASIVKIPLSPGRIEGLEAQLGGTAKRVYSVGGNLCWLAWEEDLAALDQLLAKEELTGLLLNGGSATATPEPRLAQRLPYLGVNRGGAFGTRVQQGLDPQGKFLPLTN